MQIKTTMRYHFTLIIKMIKDLNIRPETEKLLGENIGRTFNDINQNKILYDPPPRVMELQK